MTNASSQHPLERRANALAQQLQAWVNLMAAMMRPDGRALFSTRLSNQKALEFWQKHRFDDLGQSVLSTWSPDQILQLDQKLAQAHEDGNGTVGADSLA